MHDINNPFQSNYLSNNLNSRFIDTFVTISLLILDVKDNFKIEDDACV